MKKKTLGHLEYFRQNYQHPFWYSESIIQPLFLQKTKPLYPHPQIFIWDLGRKELEI